MVGLPATRPEPTLATIPNNEPVATSLEDRESVERIQELGPGGPNEYPF